MLSSEISFYFYFKLVYGSIMKLLMDMFFLSVRKLKNQPSNKLLLAPFFIQTVKEGNIRE